MMGRGVSTRPLAPPPARTRSETLRPFLSWAAEALPAFPASGNPAAARLLRRVVGLIVMFL